ncbi:MAG TPA: Uma2 family endonuclease [Trichocoleus sp.]|jgi:Uma2 family endonuclease
MPKKPIATEQRVILPNISWQQFEQLLRELGTERQVRLTYAGGKLEMMTPIEAHERCSKLLESLLIVLAEEMHLPITSIASVLLQQLEYGLATEPDTCYYFQTNSPTRHKTALVMPRDGTPDLVVEIALTKSAIDKLPIYATLGISEVWRYVTTAGDDILKGNLLIYHRQGEDYVEQSHSLNFPFLPADRILQFLEQSDSMSLAAALRVLRSWVQETDTRPA